MLGAAQANTLGTISAGAAGILGIIRVGPDLHTGDLICPVEQGEEVSLFFNGRNSQVDLADEDITGGTIHGNPIAFFDGDAIGDHCAFFEVNDYRGGANNTGNTELAGNHSSVRGGATFRGEDTFGCEHTMHVIRFGEGANHNGVLALFFSHLFGQVCIKVDLSNSSARRSIHTIGKPAAGFLGSCFGFGSELRVQQGINIISGNAFDRFFFADQPFVHHIHSDLHSGASSAFAIAALQHPQAAVLDCELNVLHIFVVDFEDLHNFEELFVGFGQNITEGIDLFSIADTSNHIFTLGVQQIIAVEDGFTIGGVTGECNTSTRIPTGVTKDHGHNIDCGAQIIGDVGGAAVVNCTFTVPRFENGFGG
ncbi:hypothetical protein SDC9_88432 [bioreactor metagenome]|uniref:Uncharacterized protein n=1 Tax=bioreactor metagenome TaxID=1076179 RepID=A0A644ZT07_9ZZZZ